MSTKNNLKKFGNRLRELRILKGLTQEQLAEKVNLSPNFVGMVERGARNTTIEKMFLLIEVLDTTPNKFFEKL